MPRKNGSAKSKRNAKTVPIENIKRIFAISALNPRSKKEIFIRFTNQTKDSVRWLTPSYDEALSWSLIALPLIKKSKAKLSIVAFERIK